MTLLLADPPLAEVRSRVTADELLARPDGDRFELVNGDLVERQMGWESELLGSNLQVLLGWFCQQANLGWVNGSNAGYQCYGEIDPDDPDRIRKPDVSFIASHRIPKNARLKGHCPIVPDLVVEVVSPNDLYEEVEAKVGEYLQVGVKLVWVVNPHTKAIRIHRANGTVHDVGLKDELSGEDVVPGFRCAVQDVFRLPGESTPLQTQCQSRP